MTNNETRRDELSGFLEGAWPASGLPEHFCGITTTRSYGSFGLGGSEPVGAVMDRWSSLAKALGEIGVKRLAALRQVHETTIARHLSGWQGLLLTEGVDGHFTTVPGTALAITTADCTPVFIMHPRGAVMALHAGWRGAAGGILEAGLAKLRNLGFPEQECHVYLGPAICGKCYEVGPETYEAVTGQHVTGKQYLDVRANLAARAHRLGVTQITIDKACTRCNAERFFSHRGGDAGRQLSIVWLV